MYIYFTIQKYENFVTSFFFILKANFEIKVWRYQMGNQKPNNEGQTIQWPKEGKWSTIHYQESKNWATQTLLKYRGELGCSSWSVCSSCYTIGTSRATHVKNLVTSHEQEKERIWLWKTEIVEMMYFLGLSR